MAKLPNVKKEKAARNRAYGRQFQKKSGRGTYKGKGLPAIKLIHHWTIMTNSIYI